MLNYKIEFNSTFENVDIAAGKISDFLHQQYGCVGGNYLLYSNFAVRELLINAVEHGNALQEEKKVICEISCSKPYISIEVTDEGDGFQLGTAPFNPIENCQISERGRGLYIIQKMGFEIIIDKNKVCAILKVVVI